MSLNACLNEPADVPWGASSSQPNWGRSCGQAIARREWCSCTDVRAKVRSASAMAPAALIGPICVNACGQLPSNSHVALSICAASSREFVPVGATLHAAARRSGGPCGHAVSGPWFVDETYVKIAGVWRYVYGAVCRGRVTNRIRHGSEGEGDALNAPNSGVRDKLAATAVISRPRQRAPGRKARHRGCRPRLGVAAGWFPCLS